MNKYLHTVASVGFLFTYVDSVQAMFPVEYLDRRQFIVKPDCNLETDLRESLR